eukprot:253667-Amphidinium_carterae.1
MTASVVRELALLSDYIYPLLGYSLEWTLAMSSCIRVKLREKLMLNILHHGAFVLFRTMNPKFVYAIPLSTVRPLVPFHALLLETHAARRL